MDQLFSIIGFVCLAVTVFSYIQFARGKDSPLEKLYRGEELPERTKPTAKHKHSTNNDDITS